jgi:hypothetical protein
MLQSVIRIDYMGPMITSTVRSGLDHPVMTRAATRVALAGPDSIVTGGP